MNSVTLDKHCRFSLAGLCAPLLVSLLILGASLGRAQVTTATFYGSVTDPTGAAIGGATATLTHQETGSVLTRTAGSEGEFSFDFLRVGHYKLSIQANGFKRHEQPGIELTAGQSVRQPFTLEIGSLTETVTVEAFAAQVNTVSAEQLNTFDSRTVTEMPLSRRNFTGILRVGAGVTGNPGSIRMDGVGRSGTGYSVDGTEAAADPEARGSANFGGGNFVDLVSMESIQEVSVVKGTLAAEYTGAAGGQVNVLTRSGTNQFHGSLFENFQAENLNAGTPFLTFKPPYTYNQYGGSAGGPIRKDKIFIFGAYEGYQQAQGVLLQGDVPTQATRDQVIRAQPSYAAPLSHVRLPNQPLASPTAVTGRVITTDIQRRHDNHVDMKGDILINAASTLALTWSHGRPYRLNPVLTPGFQEDLQNYSDRATATFVRAGASWTSETRFGYNLNDATRTNGAINFLAPENPKEDSVYGRRLGSITTNLGWSTAGGEIVVLEGPTWQIGEKFAWHRSRHSFKFGGQYTRRCCERLNTEAVVWGYTGLDDLLANIPSSVIVSFGGGEYRARKYEWGLFAQDDWRVRSDLTLNIGLRYDFHSNVVSGPHHGSNSHIVNRDGLLDRNFNVGPQRPFDSPYNHDKLNLGPRFGFSYNPGGKGTTVIRGGFGMIFSPQTLGSMWQNAQNGNVPKRVTYSRVDALRLGIKYPMYNDDIIKIVESENKSNPNKINVFNVINPHLQDPYVMHFTLGLQRQILPDLIIESGFVGSRGNKFPFFRWGNEPDRLTGLRPNPNLTMQYYIDQTGTSSYFSWQTSIKKRYSKRLSGSLHYTWGKGLSTMGGDPGAYYGADNVSFNQEFFDLTKDRGVSAGDIKHNLSSEWLYDLPAFAGYHSILRQVLGSWQLSSILIAQSGGAINVTQAGTPLHNVRPDYNGGVAVNPDWRKTLVYLNRAAFTQVPINSVSRATVRPGNLGPNAFRGPGSWTVDLGLGKNFPIREKIRLQFRADMFNSLNHVNYSNPQTAITSATFGQIQSTGTMRVIQLAAKINW